VQTLLAADEPNFGANLETRARENSAIAAKRQAVLGLSDAL
jgi:hypothetical protein